MKSFIQHLQESVLIQEGARSHALNYAAAHRHISQSQFDPGYEDRGLRGSRTGAPKISVPISPVVAARAGGIPEISTITGTITRRTPQNFSDAHGSDLAGVYNPNEISNAPGNRMNFGAIETESRYNHGLIAHELRHGSQYAGKAVNTALKTAAVPGSQANTALATFRANPTPENKQNFLDSLPIQPAGTPSTKAFSRFMSTVARVPFRSEHHDEIQKILTPSKESEGLYAILPWEMDARVQDDIRHTVHYATKLTTEDPHLYGDFHGNEHLEHLKKFNETGDVTHLNNFQTHVRNAFAGSFDDNLSDQNIHANDARRYFDALHDHIGSGEPIQHMSNPPTDREAWIRESQKALKVFRGEREKYLQQLKQQTKGAIGLILTHGVNVGGQMLQHYKDTIAPEHRKTFEQHVAQSFANRDPSLSLVNSSLNK